MDIISKFIEIIKCPSVEMLKKKKKTFVFLSTLPST